MFAIDTPIYIGDGTEVPKGKRAVKTIVLTKNPDGSPKYDDMYYMIQYDNIDHIMVYYWTLKNNGYDGFGCKNDILSWDRKTPDGMITKFSMSKLPGTTYEDLQKSR